MKNQCTKCGTKSNSVEEATNHVCDSEIKSGKEIKEIIKKNEVHVYDRSGNVAKVKERQKAITINGKEHQLNALELARMIRNVTQQIGHHKRCGNAYSSYQLHSLRLMRNQMVSDLEHYFRIGHGIDNSGRSVFYKLAGNETNELITVVRNRRIK